MNPHGATALVTGAGRRIGAACARALAALGVRVAIHCRHSGADAGALCAEIRRQGGQAAVFEADLTDGDAAGALLDRVRERFGPVGILVNNAALFEPGTLLDTSLESWNRHLALNLTAPFLLTRAMARQQAALAEPKPGKIINIIDQRIGRPRPGHLAYTTAKSALWTLTRISARELAPAIQVNAIAPGPILPAPGADDAAFRQVAAATPLGRPGSPSDIAAALLFLLHQDFITGEMIHMDGGEHL